MYQGHEQIIVRHRDTTVTLKNQIHIMLYENDDKILQIISEWVYNFLEVILHKLLLPTLFEPY